jgi:endonuclease/exonuclease/phosphatase family metal-dependent hydrolase
MFVLSPVVLFNILVAAKRSWSDSPRVQVFPVLVGTSLLLLVTFMLTFTNVWGYVGTVSHALRNRFYLPFLIAGAGMVIPLLLPVWENVFPLRKREMGSATPVVVALVISVLAIVGVAFRSARFPDPATEARRLTVLTYNMQQGSEKEGDRNFYDQLAFIRRVNPDLIGLQESDGTRPSGANIDAARFYADALGFYAYYGPNTISGTFGTAILSRFPLQNPRTFFTYSTVDEVGTAAAEIEVGGRHIAVFNNHPAGPPEVMLAHAEALVKECAKHEHVISVGDYNSRQTSPAYAVVAEVLTDSWLALYPEGVGKAHPLWRGDEPGGDELDMKGRIDHVFVSDDFTIEESYYVLVPESETDHPAHWSVISWE